MSLLLYSALEHILCEKMNQEEEPILPGKPKGYWPKGISVLEMFEEMITVLAL